MTILEVSHLGSMGVIRPHLTKSNHQVERHRQLRVRSNTDGAFVNVISYLLLLFRIGRDYIGPHRQGQVLGNRMNANGAHVPFININLDPSKALSLD
jgi:hypothetical protein